MGKKITWIAGKREPQCPPNPAFPNGIDLDLAKQASLSCTVPLPYPAKRCGHYLIECPLCGIRVGVTTAGRPDDPRSVRIPCKINGSA